MQTLKVLVLLYFHYSIVKFTSNSYSAYYINNFLTKCVPSCRLPSTLSICQCFIIIIVTCNYCMCVAVEIYWYTLDTVQYTSLNSDFVRFIAKSLVLCLYTDCQSGKVFERIHCHCWFFGHKGIIKSYLRTTASFSVLCFLHPAAVFAEHYQVCSYENN